MYNILFCNFCDFHMGQSMVILKKTYGNNEKRCFSMYLEKKKGRNMTAPKSTSRTCDFTKHPVQ